MLLDGHQLGRYQLLRQIGSGGMGTIFLAQDTHMPRQVAVKVVRADGEMQLSQEAVQRTKRLFLREMQAIARLNHPHILPVFDFGQEYINKATYAYLVMLYCPDGSLADWFRMYQNTDDFTLSEAARLFTQAAEALQHAHEHGIVHQDVKPSNFLLRARSTRQKALPDLLLADFGIAQLFSATTNNSQSHDVRGTPMFMSPEQWDGKPVPASDQYALAIMAFRLLTGQLPFQGTAGQVMRQHYMESPPAPSLLNPQLSPAIDEVILRALAKQAEQRFPDVLEFANAFSLAQQRSGDSRTVLVIEPASTPTPSLLSPSEPTPIANVASEARARAVAAVPASPMTPLSEPLVAQVQTSQLSGIENGTAITKTVRASANASSENITATSAARAAAIDTPVGVQGMAEEAFLLAQNPPAAISAAPFLGEVVFAPIAQAGLPASAAIFSPSQAANPQLPPPVLTRRKVSPLLIGLIIGLLAVIVLTSSGLLLFKNLSASKNGIGQNGAQTTATSPSGQTPVGGAGVVFTGSPTAPTGRTSTATTGQTPTSSHTGTPVPGSGSTPASGATPTSGSTPASGATPTSGVPTQPAPAPTATPTRAPQPTVAPPPPAPPTPVPGCTINPWSLSLRDISHGGTVFHVTNYCQRTVYLEFTRTPAYNADVQICFGSSDCTGWQQYASFGAGRWFEMDSGVSVGAGFTINARCHGGATCPATFTVYGSAKY